MQKDTRKQKPCQTYQDEVLNEVGQASVGEHNQSGDGSGNSLCVSLSRGVGISGVGALVAVLSATASRDQLNEEVVIEVNIQDILLEDNSHAVKYYRVLIKAPPENSGVLSE